MVAINKNDFLDVYVLKTLNEIKNKVTNNINLNKEREEEIDKKMSIVLKDLINANFKNLQMDPKGNMIYTFLPIVDEKENEKVRLSLVLYYTALYYNNVDLLHELLKENVRLEYNYYINLQYLDKSISSKFERKQYIKMLKTCGYMLRNFANSIENLSEEEREKYIERFVKLISTKYNLISDVLNKNKWSCNEKKLEYIFEKENLDTFRDEIYNQATEEQLELINRCHGNKYSKETCDRLNNLMLTRGFSNYLCNFDLMMRLCTDEQLETLNYHISNALNTFSGTEESLNKIIDFLKKRPDLARNVVCISERTFMETDTFTLIEVCDYISNTYVGDTDLNLLAKVMKPKAAIKRVLGAYKKVSPQK